MPTRAGPPLACDAGCAMLSACCDALLPAVCSVAICECPSCTGAQGHKGCCVLFMPLRLAPGHGEICDTSMTCSKIKAEHSAHIAFAHQAYIAAGSRAENCTFMQRTQQCTGRTWIRQCFVTHGLRDAHYRLNKTPSLAVDTTSLPNRPCCSPLESNWHRFHWGD